MFVVGSLDIQQCRSQISLAEGDPLLLGFHPSPMATLYMSPLWVSGDGLVSPGSVILQEHQITTILTGTVFQQRVFSGLYPHTELTHPGIEPGLFLPCMRRLVLRDTPLQPEE